MKLAVLDMDPWTFRAIFFIAGAGGALAAVAAAAGLAAHRRLEDLALHRLRRIRLAGAHARPKAASSNNLNTSCCDKLLAGAQAVVPFTMKLVPLEGQFSKLFVRHLEPSFVGILVQLGANVEPCFGGRAADQIDHDLAADQGASAPVVGDVAEHPMFDRVPLAGSGWKVTDLDLDAELIGQLLQLAFPH